MKKILPLPYRRVNAPDLSVPQLKVEPDGDHIAILNKIALAFQAQFARLARLCKTAQSDQIIDVNHLGADKAFFHI